MPANGRRGHGQGSLIVKVDSVGRATYYGKWRVGQRQVMRRIGPRRKPNTRDGLTQVQAEAELRRLMSGATPVVGHDDRRRLTDVCDLLAERKEALGRKKSTVEAYRSWNRVHFEPFFGAATVDRVDRRLIESFDGDLARRGLSPKSRRLALGILHSVFDFAIREGWGVNNPVKETEQPKVAGIDPDIRFLAVEEVEALLRAVPADDLGHVEQVLYLTAAMTGMRQGELLAFDGWTSTGRPDGSASVAPSCAGSSGRRSPSGRPEASRWRLVSLASWSSCIGAAHTRRIETSSSPTLIRANRSTDQDS